MTVAENTVVEDFTSLADPYRRELLAHCYRMLGSVHDAEDLVQETYLRAWRAYDRFEGRSSLRTWLYRIATTACLTALEGRGRRPMPTGLGGPSDDPEGNLPVRNEVPWLEPVPDAMVGTDESDPAAVVTSRESIRLAFIVALQHLPPRQRAVLILRDVLKFRAAEVAETLDITTTAANSLLQRARTQLEQVSPQADGVGVGVADTLTPEQREMLDQYVAAFENHDISTVVGLLTKDAEWEMPPYLAWFRGAETIGRVISTQCPAKHPGDALMLPTVANGQPAFGYYLKGEDGVHRPFQLHVLELTADAKVSHVSVFFDRTALAGLLDVAFYDQPTAALPDRLFPTFGLPEIHPDSAQPSAV